MPCRDAVKGFRGSRGLDHLGFAGLTVCSVSSSASRRASSRPVTAHPVVMMLKEIVSNWWPLHRYKKTILPEQNAWANKRWTCPVVCFKKIDGPPCDVADKLVFHLKVPTETLLLLIRVAPDNLVTQCNKHPCQAKSDINLANHRKNLVAQDGTNLYSHFLPFCGRVNLFAINFNRGNLPNIDKVLRGYADRRPDLHRQGKMRNGIHILRKTSKIIR